MNNKMPILIIVSLALSGCNLIEPVMPWEKAYLSVPAMTFENDKLETAYDEHIYFSKEASVGGSGVGGGGCGCN
ncbi:MAG: DUF4266 domain-containing protein [Pseudomonas sp.]